MSPMFGYVWTRATWGLSKHRGHGGETGGLGESEAGPLLSVLAVALVTFRSVMSWLRSLMKRRETDEKFWPFLAPSTTGKSSAINCRQGKAFHGVRWRGVLGAMP